MGDLVSALNPRQQEAVLHEGGPLLILAGAGSGKTRTLTHRVAHLIRERGVAPWRILAVTFTNKAAGEMRERVERLLGGGESPWVSTFHSACVRILRREIEALGYTSSFAIYDDQDQERLLKECLRDLYVAESTLTLRQAASIIDAAKNRGLGPSDVAGHDEWHEVITRVYGLYQTRLQRSNALDFTDLLLCTVRLFEEHPDVLDRYRHRFLHVLVDEYQDTNKVQYRLTKLLSSAHPNLCVVGDEDQSIYRWRGADIGNILDFEKDFPGATVIRLEQNYRSTGTILDAAGAVVAHNVERKGKTLWTENPQGEKVSVVVLEDDLDEARYVAAEIVRLRHQGRSLREAAVFYRTNAQSRSIEEALVRHRIPYVMVGGVKFFARAEVKDVLAYLRVLANPADSLAAKRIVNVPARGIGAATVERIAALDEEAGGFLAACRLALERDALKPGAATKVEAFVEMMDAFRARLDGTPYPQLTQSIIEQSGYGEMLRTEGSEESLDRLRNLDELLKGMEEHAATGQSLQDFLEQVALVTDLDSYDATTERVTLMTLHTAKGLEFPSVFITGLEEGLFPHARATNGGDDDVEEERRLCYVGMTRAMKKLTLTRCRRRRVYGDFQYNRPSRFLDEIPAHLVQVVGAEAPRASSAAAAAAARARVFEGLERNEFEEKVRVVYDTEDGLRVGSRVRHPTFGVGTIKGVEGSGASRKVTVAFRAAGVKKLMLSHAGLQPA